MAKEFLLPDIGEGLVEGEIVKWFVHEGDQIQENDPLVEVMTEKVNVEIPSPFAGTVVKIYAEEGQVVNVGEPIVAIGEEGEKAEKPKAKAKAKEAPPEAEEEAPEEVEEAPKEEVPGAPAKVLAAPAVRRLARELGVDVKEVQGTGPRGRVTADDVRKHAEAPPVVEVAPEPVEPEPEVVEPEPEAEELAPEAAIPPSRAESTPEDLVEKVPIHGIRRTISERMHQSKTTAAHFTYVEEVDVTELVALRERAKSWAEEKGVKLTYLPFILKALVAALKEHPWLNSTVDWEANEVSLKKYYNIGIATATDQGLLVPVLKDAEGKSLFTIAQEVEELAKKAREGKLTLDEVQDHTFTITSLGTLGGVLATPIINPPTVAILGVHKIAKRPMVRDGAIVVREMMNVSLSFDHRIVDGHVGAAFTDALVRYLEDPGLLLLQVLESGE